MMLIPGPVEVSENTNEASKLVINHRSEKFRSIVKNSESLLNKFSDSTHSIMTTGSGTLAVESMIYSFTRPKEQVIAVSFGEFGNRLIESAERRGLMVHKISKSINEHISAGEISDFVSNHKEIRSIFMVHNETGNGTAIKNLKDLVRESKENGLKVLVDAVSSFGGLPVKVNEWGIDVMASCSQKGLASVPGIGIVFVGREASESLNSSPDIPKYLDAKIGIDFLKKGETAFTPSTGAFNALYNALLELENETIEGRNIRHARIAQLLRRKIIESGAKVYGNDSNYSDTVIAFEPSIPAAKLKAELMKQNIEVANGMGELNGKILRIGNMGIVSEKIALEFVDRYQKIVSEDISI
ncbi:MAG: aminotransferase class V-fold PLP-dependent enzyme [Candidatus Thermoplasmatota archaeon]|nr:aminotransferase class V-fold PLP-dependent enzyme [Candidatus Thermoplasmatota archaeon]